MVGLFIENFDEHYILDGMGPDYGIKDAVYCDGEGGNPPGHIVYFNTKSDLVFFLVNYC